MVSREALRADQKTEYEKGGPKHRAAQNSCEIGRGLGARFVCRFLDFFAGGFDVFTSTFNRVAASSSQRHQAQSGNQKWVLLHSVILFFIAR